MRIALTTMLPAKTGFVWWVVDIDEPTIEAAYQSLVETQMLRGWRIETAAADAPGERLIVKRVPVVIGRGLVGALWPLDHLTLIDPDAHD